MENYNVYFISDLHISHKNILYHSPNRVKAFNLENNEDIEGHDKYNIWLSTTKRKTMFIY